MDGSRRANMVFPAPGGPTISTLCAPAAAISKARFAESCPQISAKSSSQTCLKRKICRSIHCSGRNTLCPSQKFDGLG